MEALAGAKRNGLSMSEDTASWLAGISDDLHGKLAAVGLVEPREKVEVPTLKAFIKQYVASRRDVKPATKEVWRQGEKGLPLKP